jgi:prephenate dehydrogenase
MATDILIVGLGEFGASIGLALAQSGTDEVLTGYDADGSLVREARKAGAVGRQALSLEKACRSADLVILTVPTADAQPYLEAIGPNLKQDALLLDASSYSKVAAAEWAAKNLAPGRHYVGVMAVIGPVALHVGAPDLGKPRPDLFSGGMLAMAIPPKTPENAVEMALRFSRRLGTAPFFLDPAEIDAVTATVEDLPALLGAVLVRVAMRTPSWQEARRMGGRRFASVAIVGALQPAKHLQASLSFNRTNILTRLDATIEELQTLRDLIARGENEPLSSLLAEAIEVHDAWLAARYRADWAQEERGKIELPEGRMMDRIIGLGPNLRPKDRR